MITRSGKELKFVENKTVEDYFETTHVKLFQNFTGSLSGKTFWKYSLSADSVPSPIIQPLLTDNPTPLPTLLLSSRTRQNKIRHDSLWT